MTSNHDRRRSSTPGLLAVMLACAIAREAHAQVAIDEVQARSVKVTVGDGAGGQVASGFLWKSQNQVVTSLHTFSKRTTDSPVIRVRCAGLTPQISKASVIRVLKQADLVLLRTDDVLKGCKAFDTSRVSEAKPKPGEALHTFGYKGGAASGTSRKMEKGAAEEPELLRGLLEEPQRSQVAAGTVPSIDLPVYYVQGGLLPGYSGAPVVNSRNELVGIVEGGLDKGASDYNWLIPVANLAMLEASPNTQLPPPGFLGGDVSFSSGYAEEAGDTSIEVGSAGKLGFQFEKLKTRPIRELVEIEELATLLGTDAERTALAQVQLDIYGDEAEGVIIAVPAGQALESTATRDGAIAVFSNASGEHSATIVFRVDPLPEDLVIDRQLAADPRWADRMANALLKDCNSDAWGFAEPHECTNLKDGAQVELIEGGYSVAVVFQISTTTKTLVERRKMFVRPLREFVARLVVEMPEENPHLSLAQVSNMAAHLSTFYAGPEVDAGPAGMASASRASEEGRLAEGRSDRSSLALEAGQEYTLFGMCDDKCHDINLGVFEDGVLLTADTNEDAEPMVTFLARPDKAYELQVEMESCKAAECAYEVGVAATGAGTDTTAPLEGRLVATQSVDWPLQALEGGRNYSISGECDEDCRDLDFAVLQNGEVLTTDLEDNDEPRVTFSAVPGKSYALRVGMAECTSKDCHWKAAIGDFGNWTAQQSIPTLEGGLASGQSLRVLLPPLQPGQNYRISGDCDDECDDLDLAVFQKDKQLDADEEEDAFPVVDLAPRRNSTYELEVTMASCGTSLCQWTITIGKQ